MSLLWPGERIRRKLKGGGIREHIYYRCANNYLGPDHPRVRWKSEDLERAIADDLAGMRLECIEFADWFRKQLGTAVTDLTSYRRKQSTSLEKRRSELTTMQERLLNAYLAGTIQESVYQAKSNEFKAEIVATGETLANLGDVDPACGETALAVFDFTQKAADLWRGSNITVEREILDLICLNRALSDVSLVTVKRKPFDHFANRGPI